jgi:hypothetical protein
MVDLDSAIEIVNLAEEIFPTAIRIRSLLQLFASDLLPKDGELGLMLFMLS